MRNFLDYLTALGHYELAGVAGFVCYIGAFGAVQFGLMDGNSIGYSLTNILAASLVGISLFAEFNLASALIQSSWIIIGLIGLSLRFARRVPGGNRTRTAPLDAEVL